MNMELWEKVSTPPPETLKVIGAGRLKGMTDIKPQWRYQIMTEVYGMCGIGWKFNVVKKWSEQGSDNQLFAFADIELFIKVDGEWSDPIPGTGGSMLVTKEKAGLHSSDEGYKMAITDALSTAMKVIGVASEIYMGNWNGSKYKEETKEPEKPIKKTITTDQSNKLVKLVNDLIPNAGVKDYKSAAMALGIDSTKTSPAQFDMLWEQANKNNFAEVIKVLELN